MWIVSFWHEFHTLSFQHDHKGTTIWYLWGWGMEGFSKVSIDMGSPISMLVYFIFERLGWKEQVSCINQHETFCRLNPWIDIKRFAYCYSWKKGWWIFRVRNTKIILYIQDKHIKQYFFSLIQLFLFQKRKHKYV